jgi:3-hydroxyisobutyrate dehydrogenase/glyoxylate/succinic semialdehyde reductase
LWVECSTVNPSFAREMGGEAEIRGLRYLDAPVSGTRGPAEKGELAFVVGGDPGHLEAARPLLDAMGSTVTHVGGVGMGAAMKMVRNLLLGQGLLAFAEALLLGESLGIARETLLETLLGGNMTPAFLAGKKSRFAGESFEPDFPLRWMHKDLQLVNRTAYEQGLALPGAAAAQSAYGLARRAGLGGLDFSAVYRFLKDPGASG